MEECPGWLAEPSLFLAPRLVGSRGVCLTPWLPCRLRVGHEEGLPSFGSPLTWGSLRELELKWGSGPGYGVRAPALLPPGLRFQ